MERNLILSLAHGITHITILVLVHTYFSVPTLILITNINKLIEIRIHPNADLDIKCGNNGVTHESMVAMESIDDAIMGNVERHVLTIPTTSAIVCIGGFAFGNDDGFDMVMLLCLCLCLCLCLFRLLLKVSMVDVIVVSRPTVLQWKENNIS